MLNARWLAVWSIVGGLASILVTGAAQGDPAPAVASAVTPPLSASSVASSSGGVQRQVSVEVIARTRQDARFLCTDGPHVYWALPETTRMDSWTNASGEGRVVESSNGDAAIHRVSVSGGAIEPVVQGISSIKGLGLSADQIFWSGDIGCGGFLCLPTGWVRKQRKEGGAVTDVWPDASVPEDEQAMLIVGPIVPDGSSFLMGTNDRTVSIPTTGGPVVTARTRYSARVTAFGGSVVIRDGWAYWTERDRCSGGACDRNVRIRREPTTGGNASDLAVGLGHVLDLAADGQHVYVAVGGGVSRVPVAGGTLEILRGTVGKDVREVETANGWLYLLAGSHVLRMRLDPPQAP